jgi:hypothetical protein
VLTPVNGGRRMQEIARDALLDGRITMDQLSGRVAAEYRATLERRAKASTPNASRRNRLVLLATVLACAVLGFLVHASRLRGVDTVCRLPDGT